MNNAEKRLFLKNFSFVRKNTANKIIVQNIKGIVVVNCVKNSLIEMLSIIETPRAEPRYCSYAVSNIGAHIKIDKNVPIAKKYMLRFLSWLFATIKI